MENASKALIIAGAILLSISIIGIGMFIFSQAQESIDGAGLSTEQVSTYNSRFLNYEGTQKGTSVRTLCDTVRTHNSQNVDDISRQITVQIGSAASITSTPTAAVTATDVNNVKAQIAAGKTYTVDFGYDANSGLVVAIGFTEKK